MKLITNARGLTVQEVMDFLSKCDPNDPVVLYDHNLTSMEQKEATAVWDDNSGVIQLSINENDPYVDSPYHLH